MVCFLGRAGPLLSLCMYFLKSIHELQRLTEDDNNRSIHKHIFCKVLCISNYTLLFSALNPVRWNVDNNASYHNKL